MHQIVICLLSRSRIPVLSAVMYFLALVAMKTIPLHVLRSFLNEVSDYYIHAMSF